MHYEGNMIRPPSEANSILLQVTVGCSHNKCTFCGAYKGERFKIKPMNIIMEDITFASQYCRQQKRLFLCDGDALIMSQKKLPGLLKEIKTQLPWVNRVGTYANAKSLKRKTLNELKEMKELGLGIIYMGLESGDDETLANVQKKGNANDMIEQGRKVKDARIKLSITVLIGLAGTKRRFIHARETGRVLSAIDPEYVGALSLMLTPNTPLYEDWKAGKFELIDSKGMLVELGAMIAHTNLSRGLFFANHASNYLPIKARLPREKEETIKLIEDAIEGKIPLKPEMYRAL
jgi:radical SAM superfamily enzyme YgiQ (UPF0313 family)